MTKEDVEQIAIMQWAVSSRAKYPELKLLHHIPNERKCSPQQGQYLKRKGVKAGVPDLCLPIARKGYNGMYIELKRSDGGRLSDEQKWWLEELTMQGYAAIVCHGADEAIRAIKDYLSGSNGFGSTGR